MVFDRCTRNYQEAAVRNGALSFKPGPACAAIVLFVSEPLSAGLAGRGSRNTMREMKDDGKTRPRSLVRQSADLIRERIEAGQLGPMLPGENELARMLDVSRPTIRGALDLLEGESVVAAVSRGMAREVKKDWFGRKKTGPAVRFLIASPLHERSAGFQAGMRQMRERLASHGAEVVVPSLRGIPLEAPGADSCQGNRGRRMRCVDGGRCHSGNRSLAGGQADALRVCRRILPPPPAAHRW